MCNINAQPDDMDLMIFPQRGNFRPVDQLQRQLLSGDFPMRGGQACCGIVIGNGEGSYTHLNGAMHQLFWRERAIGGDRMAVKIVDGGLCCVIQSDSEGNGR